MEVRSGARVRARGLIWDVLEADGAPGAETFNLRCVEGDMAGLEWEIHRPPDRIDPVADGFDPSRPSPLALWRLMHRAHLLDELSDGRPRIAADPGRLRVEPYQLVPLLRALEMPRVRLLLADGVGLGKTIQAGLIAAELIARRRAHRILIAVPAGPLLAQWDREMRARFGLVFTRMSSAAELWDARRAQERGANPFSSVPLCLTALDFAKQDHVLEEIERSAWDLVIVDEAHHCVAMDGREPTRRRRLADVLARQSDGLLLLTATPHDGHDAHFASLIALLDPSLVDGMGGFAGRDYRRHMIRRLKPHIRDGATGAALFRRRHVLPVKVDVNGDEHEAVRAFHSALAAFVVPRLRRPRGADDALAFVSLLKRSVSTLSACVATLRVVMDRIERREAGDGDTRAARAERARALRMWRRRAARFGTLNATDEAGQDAAEIESMAETLRREPATELARLIRMGTEAAADDPKLAALMFEVRMIRAEYPRANILVYTEYTDSQTAAALALRAGSAITGQVLTIGGQDSEEARADAAARFGEQEDLILISTDSLAEGLNLHRHCFHLIHLDLPYNPNRLEQRNGRIDRYGQTRESRIRYLYLPGTFEARLLLHLIAKYEKARASLDVMPDTLGVTAAVDEHETALLGGFAEDTGDMFAMDGDPIHPIGRAMEEIHPASVTDLIREIDRAFDDFDLMAVAHGWHGARALNAGMTISGPVVVEAGTMAAFVADVIAAETGQSVACPGEIPLPVSWRFGVEDMPGYDTRTHAVRVTRDFDVWRGPDGADLTFLGHAHPLAARAIRHGCRLPGRVATADGTRLGLLTTFVLEIQVGHRTIVRRIAGILAAPDGTVAEAEGWRDVAEPGAKFDRDGFWDRHFASWSDRAAADTERLMAGIAAREEAAFTARHDARRADGIARAERWLRARSALLCGVRQPRTGDLFGAPDTEPAWRDSDDPRARLIGFATDPSTSPGHRRDANAALEIFQAAVDRDAVAPRAGYRPIGLLMMVPPDVV